MMGDMVNPEDASIDGLIDWLRVQRRRAPNSPLSSFLDAHQVAPQLLIDLACIDLMQRRRMGHSATVEDYLEEFPELGQQSHLLDLIDAEICIAAELDQPIPVDRYVSRFPELGDQVRELAQLEMGAEADMKSAIIDLGDDAGSTKDEAAEGDDASTPQGDDFSLQILPGKPTSSRQFSPLPEHLLDVPEWFIGDQCVASGHRRWLVRGRDAVRGTALAMKVIELPLQLSAAQSDQLLDACEIAAKVRNQSWVPPSIAAIQQRHLGVIRPWQFGSPWQMRSGSQGPTEQLRTLAQIAFSVESAHRIGATHGGIHAENLLVNHEGKVQLLDGAASRSGLDRWLNPSEHQDADRIASLDQRRSLDVQDMIRLVAAASVEWDQLLARDLVAQLRSIAADSAGETCGQIGQTLMRHADSWSQDRPGRSSRPTHHPNWRKRLARWLTKDE